MPIELLGVGTDPLPGRFQFPTPNNSIGPSEVARDGFKAGWIRLPVVGGRFLNNTSCGSTVAPKAKKKKKYCFIVCLGLVGFGGPAHNQSQAQLREYEPPETRNVIIHRNQESTPLFRLPFLFL
jgi:hypothetical protein